MKKTKFQQLLATIPPETRNFVRKQGDISEKMMQIMQQRNLNQKELADMLGMEKFYLLKILAGNANMTLKMITKIETVLGEEILKI